MVEKHTERKLAAILAADVAGYSRLMAADEEGTLARLRGHLRELVEPSIAAHRGRIVERMGDGLLVDFPSAVEAVRCAVAVQAGMAERNRAAPAEQRIEFRIGINLGDVMIDGDDLYGDGAQAHFSLGDDEAAARLLRERVARNPGTDASRMLLAACYGHLGRAEDARAVWAELLQVSPGFSLAQRARVLPYQDPGDLERIADGLAKAGLP